ncbi:hypothetical protein HPB52_018057 [Rhipicephalus sanguineus]|uniref:Uncharacterized protein n=1 Tax=Rhipicephalus sanguineus TaxID=34632 RepID=A0A9D4SZY4_RHISA|nr:hypothetical protein HPB52_018057 [Rhipicephalus sanguineus]
MSVEFMETLENHRGFQTTPTTSHLCSSTSLRAAVMLLGVLKGQSTDEIPSQQSHRTARLREVTHQWCQLSRKIHHNAAMAAQGWNPRQHVN